MKKLAVAAALLVALHYALKAAEDPQDDRYQPRLPQWIR